MSHECQTSVSALTRREIFAAMAMNGILAANAKCAEEVTDKNVDQVVAREAVASADALIAELDNSPNDKPDRSGGEGQNCQRDAWQHVEGIEL